MIFDWFTAVAQLVNFVILILLLRWLLYGRIKNAIQERQRRMDDALASAKQREQEAEEKAREFRKKTEELEQDRKRRVQEAQREADGRRDALLKEAREEANALSRRWKEQVRRERQDLVRRLRQKVAAESCSIAGKALRELAGAALEEQIARHMREHLQNMGDEEREEALAPFRDAEELKVATAFELPEDARNGLRDVLRGALPDSRKFSFGVDGDLACGVEVRTEGHTLGWSVQSYLADFKEELARVIEERLGREQQPDEEQTRENAKDDD